MDLEQQKKTISFLSKLNKPPEKNPAISLKYIELPFDRIKPYIPGISPFDAEKWPNEPMDFIKVPVVVTPAMSEDDIMREALSLRDNLIDKWLAAGGCLMGEEEFN